MTSLRDPDDHDDPSLQAISAAERVLDGLLDVVRHQAEVILDSARSEAAFERESILAAARAEAAEIVERTQEEMAEAMERARHRLGEAMAVLADESSVADDSEAAEPVAFTEVDPAAMRVLARELGPDACREVVETFLAELTNQLDYLGTVSMEDDADVKKVGRTLHNLSSGCATVGAFGVAKLCDTATADDLADHIEELVERCQAVRAEVERLVAEGLIDD